MSIKRIDTGPRMSQAVVHNGIVYTAGQVAQGAPGASIADQTKDILASIDRLLAEAGTDKSKLISATIWSWRPTAANSRTTSSSIRPAIWSQPSVFDR